MDPRKIVRTGLRVIGLLVLGLAICGVLALVADAFMSKGPWEEMEYERKIQDLERNLEFPVPATGQEGPTLIPTDETFHPSQKLPPPST